MRCPRMINGLFDQAQRFRRDRHVVDEIVRGQDEVAGVMAADRRHSGFLADFPGQAVGFGHGGADHALAQ